MTARRAIDVVTLQASTLPTTMARAVEQAQASVPAGERVLVVYGPEGANIYSESKTQPRPTREPRR